jgi:hypothetical protein
MEDLMTVQELAVHYSMAERTIRRWIVDTDIEPEELRVNPKGSKTPLYSRSKLDIAMSNYTDLKHLSQLSEGSKETFVKGLIVQDMSREQLVEMLQVQQKQLAITEQALLEEKAYSDGVWKQAHENNRRILQQQIEDSSKQYECLLRDLWKCRKRLGLDPFTGNIIK